MGGYLQQKYVGDKQDLALMTKLGISEVFIHVNQESVNNNIKKIN